METEDRTNQARRAAPVASPASAFGSGSLVRDLRVPLIWLALLAAVTLAVRPPIPVDETRYLSVAWEMWTSGNLLVPHLNGLPYSHKPPLLFWLINAGWELFGVAGWWPRLVPALCLAASLFLTLALGRELWPGRPALPRRAAVLLQGSLLFAILATYLLFDPLLVACALVAVLGLVRAARGGGLRAWGLAGLGIGLGILAKGPVILLHTLPVALAGPWWSRGLEPLGPGRARPTARRWYGGVALAVIVGAAIGLAWAIPAALAGGAEYGRAILLGQTTGRLAESFAHRRPAWWYLPLLPVLVFPFGFWPPLYRALYRGLYRGRGRLPSLLAEPGVRFALAQGLPVLAVFSLISGKQPQYLAPLLPAGALLAARLAERAPRPRRWEIVPPLLLPLAVALALILLQLVAGRQGVPGWAGLISPGAGVLFGIGAVLYAVHVLRRSRRVPAPGAGPGAGPSSRPDPGEANEPGGSDGAAEGLAVLSVALVAVLYLALAPMFTARYDLEPMARFVRLAETRGAPVAHIGEYRGELHFLGRLERPFEEVERADVAAWFDRHPEGLVLEPASAPETGEAARVRSGDLAGAAFVQPIRSKVLAAWTREGWARRGVGIRPVGGTRPVGGGSGGG